MSERIGSGYCEKLRNCNDNNSSAIESGGFSNFMSQQRRRGNPAVVDEMPGVYAADPNMFSEIFNFQTGVELLGVPKDDNVHGSKLGVASPSWRVSNGHQQYVEFNGQNMALNALKEGNMNVQGLPNMDANAMQLYLMNPANNGDYSSPANPPSSNMVASFSSLDNNHGSQINKNSFGAEIPLQIPSFGMGRQGLCVNQMPNRESWQGGGVNELLLLPTANGNMQNNTQFTNPPQMNHNNSTVNWTSRHAGSMQPSTSQWCEDDCKVGDFGFRNRDDGRSVQGLSLSLSSNYQMQVQPFETNRLISSQLASDAKSRSHDVNKLGYFTRSDGVSRGIWNPHGGVSGPTHINIASSSSAVLTGYLKHSKYLKPTLQLLEEFCNVATKGMKSLQTGHAPKKLEEEKAKDKEKESSLGMSYSVRESGRKVGSSVTICGNTSTGTTGICSEGGNNQISFAGDRFELRRRKAKLLWMLDEVERRYRHYCDQMKIVITSFESVAGPGAAATYTSLASKAMSRHFRCLKDAITGQIKATNEALGEKESNYPGVTKGETPRLKYLEQSLRQQRTFQQVGMLEQDAWRPQRGLPERAVTVLRAWLFEHFLHPYPSDADKHLLARQTGLSRSQVSNWFINARVRLWKPMVEDMYQEEFKEAEKEAKNPTNLSSHDNAALKNEARGSDSNKSCEELKKDLASLTAVPESSGAISLPLESQDEIFDSTIMTSFLRNTNTSSNRNSRKGESMENVETHGNKVQGSSQVGGSGEFSSYISNNNNNGMFTKYFGSGDVSLTLGLRHSGALSVPVADQEKYHNALYNLP